MKVHELMVPRHVMVAFVADLLYPRRGHSSPGGDVRSKVLKPAPYYCQKCESNRETFVDDSCAQPGRTYAVLVCLGCKRLTVLHDSQAPHTVGTCFKPTLWQYS